MNRYIALSLFVALGLTIPASHVVAAPDQAGSREEIRKELLAQRKTNLARLHKYRVKRVYPHNSYEEGKLNVWTDADGHLCAVATLMDVAGLHDLVAKVARDENFVRVADLSSGPLLDWVLTSGFTQEEIVMIQQPTAADIEQMEEDFRREKRKQARKLAREDDRLEANYIKIERALKSSVVADAGLDIAVARLAARPDLVAALHAKSK